MGEKTPNVNNTKESRELHLHAVLNKYDEKGRVEEEVNKDIPSNLVKLAGLEIDAKTFYINDKGERIDAETNKVLSAPTGKTMQILKAREEQKDLVSSTSDKGQKESLVVKKVNRPRRSKEQDVQAEAR